HYTFSAPCAGPLPSWHHTEPKTESTARNDVQFMALVVHRRSNHCHKVIPFRLLSLARSFQRQYKEKTAAPIGHRADLRSAVQALMAPWFAHDPPIDVRIDVFDPSIVAQLCYLYLTLCVIMMIFVPLPPGRVVVDSDAATEYKATTSPSRSKDMTSPP
ncbi:hypothetical protein EDB84DRAFT_1603398, partial [Lactarius hengduanensis]